MPLYGNFTWKLQKRLKTWKRFEKSIFDFRWFDEFWTKRIGILYSLLNLHLFWFFASPFCHWLKVEFTDNSIVKVLIFLQLFVFRFIFVVGFLTDRVSKSIPFAFESKLVSIKFKMTSFVIFYLLIWIFKKFGKKFIGWFDLLWFWGKEKFCKRFCFALKLSKKSLFIFPNFHAKFSFHNEKSVLHKEHGQIWIMINFPDHLKFWQNRHFRYGLPFISKSSKLQITSISRIISRT